VKPLDVVQIIGDVGRQELERLELVRLEEIGEPVITLLVRAVLNSIVDAEVNLRHLSGVLRLERLLLDETYNLLEVERITVQLAVQNRASGEAVNLGTNVVHMRERLACTAVKSLA